MRGVGRCAWVRDACRVAAGPRKCTVCPVGKAQEQSAVIVVEGCQGHPGNVTEGQGLGVRKLAQVAGPRVAPERPGRTLECDWKGSRQEQSGCRGQQAAEGVGDVG